MRYNADLVCVCADITRQEIQEAARQDKMADLYEAGMCQWCQSCKEEIEEILEEELIQDDDS